MISVFDHEAPRLGRFRLSSVFLSFENEELTLLMSSIIVVETRHDLTNRTVEYTAYSLSFDPIERGESVPEYVALFDRDLSCVPVLRLKWKRADS